jgi:hypothetical protein
MAALRQRKGFGETEKETPLPGGVDSPPAPDREKDVALFLIRCIVACIPKRWNTMNLEIGMTSWEDRLRVQWLDSGLYKRKLVWAAVIFVIVLVALLVSTMIPWRLLLKTDVEHVYTDTRGREIQNILVPRLIDPKNDASDAQIANQILKGAPFRELTPQVVKQGYAGVRGSNVSLDMLRGKLVEAGRKYPCLCAAHMGIPLNAISFFPRGGKGGKKLFMLEPSPTGATGKAIESDKMQSNLDPGVPFRVTHPTRMSVKFLTMDGLVDRTELRGDDSACAVWCIELAWKEALVEEDGGGILSQRPRETGEKGQSVKQLQYVGFG